MGTLWNFCARNFCSGSGWQLVDSKWQWPEKRSTANVLSIAIAKRARAKSPPPNGGIGIVEIR
jgi:hypothetical protein